MSEQDDRGGLPSASSMDRYARCPGSRKAEAGLPELLPEQVTADGTEIHESMESGDVSDLSAGQKEIKERLAEAEDREVQNWLHAVENNEI